MPLDSVFLIIWCCLCLLRSGHEWRDWTDWMTLPSGSKIISDFVIRNCLYMCLLRQREGEGGGGGDAVQSQNNDQCVASVMREDRAIRIWQKYTIHKIVFVYTFNFFPPIDGIFQLSVFSQFYGVTFLDKTQKEAGSRDHVCRSICKIICFVIKIGNIQVFIRK